MENLSQDYVVRLKFHHEKLGVFEFVIPNNTPTVDALEVLAVWQKVLLDSLKPREQAKEELKKEDEACLTTTDLSDSSTATLE